MLQRHQYFAVVARIVLQHIQKPRLQRVLIRVVLMYYQRGGRAGGGADSQEQSRTAHVYSDYR